MRVKDVLNNRMRELHNNILKFNRKLSKIGDDEDIFFKNRDTFAKIIECISNSKAELSKANRLTRYGFMAKKENEVKDIISKRN